MNILLELYILINITSIEKLLEASGVSVAPPACCKPVSSVQKAAGGHSACARTTDIPEDIQMQSPTAKKKGRNFYQIFS